MMPIVVSLVLAVALFMLWSGWRTAARAEFIRKFHLPKGLFDKLTAKHPQLTRKDCELVAQALRQFFLAHLKSGREFVAMPSQVTDDLWHELILHTRTYAKFCQGSFGRFMHHTPAVELGSARVSNTGLRRCWWFACREENINPRQPTRLPLLFAIDSKLNIKDGFRYVPDCSGLREQGASGSSSAIHCGTEFGSASFDGSTDGFGDSGGDSGSDGGDGGGCGGGGD